MHEPFESLSKDQQFSRLMLAAAGDIPAARWVLAEVPRDLVKPEWIVSLEQRVDLADERSRATALARLNKERGVGSWKGVLIALAFVVGGFGIAAIASSYTTPYSVAVRGYVRSDGAHVSGYNRRPPGSRRHDAPFEFVTALGSLTGLGGLIAGGVFVYRRLKEGGGGRS